MGNITRRVLNFIREAYFQQKEEGQAPEATLQDLLTFPSERSKSFDDIEFKRKFFNAIFSLYVLFIFMGKDLKGIVATEFQQLSEELDTIYSSISKLSVDHIHAE